MDSGGWKKCRVAVWRRVVGMRRSRHGRGNDGLLTDRSGPVEKIGRMHDPERIGRLVN